MSDDPHLTGIVAELIAPLGLVLDPAASAAVVDPALPVTAIRAALSGVRAATAVLRDSRRAAGVLAALRSSRALLVDDPRDDPRSLVEFVTDTFALSRSTDRRGYPRSTGSGLEVVEPAAALLDFSPYSARLHCAAAALADSPTITVRLRATHDGLEEDVPCQVVRRAGDELAVRFVHISGTLQQELFRCVKTDLLRATIEGTFQRCQAGPVAGYRAASRRELDEVLEAMVASRAAVTFAVSLRGRLCMGTISGIDRVARTLAVRSGADGAPAPGTYLRYAVAVQHESLLLDGYVLAAGDGTVRLTWPAQCFLSDRRAAARVDCGAGSPLTARCGAARYPVRNFSASGFELAAGRSQPLPQLGVHPLIFECDGAEVLSEAVLIHSHRPRRDGYRVAGSFLDRNASFRGEPIPIVEEHDASGAGALREATRGFPSEVVHIGEAERALVGLWNEVDHPGPRAVVVIPPCWAKTKESVALLAQFLCATFDANQRHVAVLRFDYRNTLGESYKPPQAREPGLEAVGYTTSGGVADIRAAVAFACARARAERVALVGMSFSGPLCLRAAVEDERVTELIMLMGASDIQDLIRTSTGGIDYIANYRAGATAPRVNILGLITDLDCIGRDGVAARLVYLQDAQADATRLKVPLLWIHGLHDAFVNEARIRGVLAAATAAPAKRLVTVPTGHVPTKSADAISSYLPAARFLLANGGVDQPVLAVPALAQAKAIAEWEWARAPHTQLASPADYWRRYMLGEGEQTLGFDVLAMTDEYDGMMRLQAQLLDVPADGCVHDVGGGLGHAIRYLLDGTRRTCVVYDLVPELLAKVSERYAHHGPRLETCCWDADREPVPERLGAARHVLMSLMLSCLRDAPAFLRRLKAVLPAGARVVASSMKHDPDVSLVYRQLIARISAGDKPPPAGFTREAFAQAVRDYMCSAAWLLRLAEEGTFQFYSPEEFRALFAAAGFRVMSTGEAFGPPFQAVVLVAES